jgi:2-polyprenyl-3-methyl-5-hydroxy-6-metoxy-1,4-benzoquinol methylase
MKIDYQNEEEFHDQWAESVNVEDIDVRQMNESITAPEMRFITKTILQHKQGGKLLDIGCGLGEASVYFAMEGFDVTATDISNEMLVATKKLGKLNKVDITTQKCTAESLMLDENEKFDIIYVGNLFHHVDIPKALIGIKKHLKPDGLLVSWDPVAYNPIINIYRRMAMEVRTEDEHPLKIKDLRLFKKNFQNVETKYFWFTTLIIFILMYLVQRKNPNKVRFWKAVVEDGDKWSWLYKPLASIDNFILKIFPFFKPLCWNVVIVAKNPINK